MKIRILIIAIILFSTCYILPAGQYYNVLGLSGKVSKIAVININRTEYINIRSASKFFSLNNIITDHNTSFQSGLFAFHFLPGSFYFVFKYTDKTYIMQMTKPAVRIGSDIFIPLFDYIRCLKSSQKFLISAKKRNIYFKGLITQKKEEIAIVKQIKNKELNKVNMVKKSIPKNITKAKIADSHPLETKIETQGFIIKNHQIKQTEKQTENKITLPEKKAKIKQIELPPDYKPDMYLLPEGLIRHEVEDSFNKKTR